MKLFLLLFTFFLSLSLEASQKNLERILNDIANLSAQALYDVNEESLPTLLAPIMQQNKMIQAIEIRESIDNEIIFKSFTKENKLVFNEEIPQKQCANLYKIKNIFFNKEQVGTIKLYFKPLSSINFTQEEYDWIAAYPVKVGVEEWKHIIHLDSHGNLEGISGDYMRLIAKKSGLTLVMIGDTWDTILEKLQNQEIDVIPDAYYVKQRTEYALFSDSYFKINNYIYIRENDNSITGFKSLKNKKIALTKGHATIVEIKQKFPQIEIVETASLDESIALVLSKQVDAMYDARLVLETKINDEFIRGIRGIPDSVFQSKDLHFLVVKKKPILHSIIQKTLKSITKEERNTIHAKYFKKMKRKKIDNTIKEKEISFIGLMSLEELAIVFLLFLFFAYVLYNVYLKSDVLDIKLKKFIKIIIAFELFVIFFILYEVVVLDRTEHALVKSQKEQKSMIDVLNRFVQSSSDLTNFIRMYAISNDKKYEKQYLEASKIKYGKKARPKNFTSLYWDLHKENRDRRHAKGKKISLEKVIEKNNFAQEELFKLKQAQEIESILIQIELEAFVLISDAQNSQALDVLLSPRYFQEKHNVMLLIDEVTAMLYERTNTEVDVLNKKITNQFIYILLMGLFFILGNIFIYILFSKKLLEPIGYLTKVILQFQNNEKIIEKKSFYKDEIGEMNREFFMMQEKLEEQTKATKKQQEFTQTLLDSQEQIIITTNDEQIMSANETFFDFFAVDSVEDFMEAYEAKCVCETFNTNAPEGYLQTKMGRETWIEYVVSRTFDTSHKVMISMGSIDFIFSVSGTKLPGDEGLMSAVFTNITDMEVAKRETEQILANILLPVLITSKKERIITYANKYAEKQYKMTLDEIIGKDIDSIYTVKGQHEHIVEAIQRDGYIENSEEEFITASGEEFTALLSVIPITYQGIDSYIGMVADITEQKEREKEIAAIHKHTRESIEYASLIQGALIPNNTLFRKYFKDYFAIWHPKDLVGGDIYLFEELRHNDECLLMVIDCTGHGVPGAFVTMLVKAIERQITAKINHNPDEIVSPAKILSIFNKNMKQLLKQEDSTSISNAGFDGQIVYYNKKENILKCASARNEIFYYQNDELHIIKGDRHSVGYKDSDINYEFTEHVIDLYTETTVYISSDGFWDQNGGEKSLPFGKKRFKKLLSKVHNEKLADQQEEFLYTFEDYKGDEEVNDDVTVIGIKI
ncbi:transporter substrate-binding domain-containing protein [Sulfurimonas sp. SAG-AH-194-I05]|nr:transporter substrate-binding domain-containing protein [Sulfurimonas sp. SAG-AH-194-I05]MDF1874525.1 transporter substrate-binding domain-containing protein [Sulfurimonas sp. SAG-AH-194-I05]